MTAMMIRAQMKDECVTEVEDAVRRMFDAIAAAGPAGVQYASMRVANSSTFVVFLAHDGEENPLTAIPEFNAVQAALPGWVAQPPVMEQVQIVGSYGVF